MKHLFFILIIICSFLSCFTQKNNQPLSKENKNKILIICTNIDTVNGQKNGTFLSEIAIPFILLEEENYEIDIVSPQGGPIPIYYKFDTTEIIKRALHSKYYNQQINNSKKANKINFKDYNALILPGGYGQFWDIHSHTEINKLIANIHENGGIIASLGHGTSSLVNVHLSNNEPLVKGVTLTCFPSWFEKEIMFEADYGKLLPFDMEEELINKGANLKRVDKETRSNGQIVDTEHKIITASSATGGEFIVEEILKLMNK